MVRKRNIDVKLFLQQSVSEVSRLKESAEKMLQNAGYAIYRTDQV